MMKHTTLWPTPILSRINALISAAMVLMCTFGIFPAPATAQTQHAKIHICAVTDHVFHAMIADAIKEAYRRIDVEVTFTWLPNRRSLIEANDGKCGGEMMRIAGVERTFENLIRIPVSITQLEGVAFMNHVVEKDLPYIKSWEDLRDLRSYIILGELYAEQGTQDMVVGQVRNYKQLFEMLTKGHIDVGVGIREVGRVELTRHFPGSTIHVHGDTLARSPMYHYIHKDNQHLAQRLEQVLNEMALKGEIKALNDAALERLAEQP